MESVNVYISDLFFNYLQSPDDDRQQEANDFLHALSMLGVKVPSKEALLADFDNRL